MSAEGQGVEMRIGVGVVGLLVALAACGEPSDDGVSAAPVAVEEAAPSEPADEHRADAVGIERIDGDLSPGGTIVDGPAGLVAYEFGAAMPDGRLGPQLTGSIDGVDWSLIGDISALDPNGAGSARAATGIEYSGLYGTDSGYTLSAVDPVAPGEPTQVVRLLTSENSESWELGPSASIPANAGLDQVAPTTFLLTRPMIPTPFDEIVADVLEREVAEALCLIIATASAVELYPCDQAERTVWSTDELGLSDEAAGQLATCVDEMLAIRPLTFEVLELSDRRPSEGPFDLDRPMGAWSPSPLDDGSVLLWAPPADRQERNAACEPLGLPPLPQRTAAVLHWQTGSSDYTELPAPEEMKGEAIAVERYDNGLLVLTDQRLWAVDPASGWSVLAEVERPDEVLTAFIGPSGERVLWIFADSVRRLWLDGGAGVVADEPFTITAPDSDWAEEVLIATDDRAIVWGSQGLLLLRFP